MLIKRINIFLLSSLALICLFALSILYAPIDFIDQTNLVIENVSALTTTIVSNSLIFIFICAFTLLILELINKERRVISRWTTVVLVFFAFIIFVVIVKNYFVTSESKKNIVDNLIVLSTIVFALLFTLSVIFKSKKFSYNRLFQRVFYKAFITIIAALLLFSTVIYSTVLFSYFSIILNKLIYISDVLGIYAEKAFNDLLTNQLIDKIFVSNTNAATNIYISLFVISLVFIITIHKVIEIKASKSSINVSLKVINTIDEFLVVIKNSSLGFLYKSIP